MTAWWRSEKQFTFKRVAVSTKRSLLALAATRRKVTGDNCTQLNKNERRWIHRRKNDMPRIKRRLPAQGGNERRNRRSEFISSLKDESDRGLVLISAEFIGEMLREVLQTCLLQNTAVTPKLIASLFEVHAPLEPFSARVKFAFLLSLVDKETFEDLETIREIRNHFAHDYGRADLGDEKVASLTRTLRAANRAVSRFGASPDFNAASSEVALDDQSKKEKARFVLAASEIVNRLEKRLREFPDRASS
jgi:DNA-binding MltR family transcriptional regulator